MCRLDRLELRLQFGFPSFNVKRQRPAVKRSHVADDGPEFLFGQGIFEGRHGRDREVIFIVDHFLQRGIPHVPGNRVEDFLVGKGRHRRVFRQVAGTGVRHASPVKPFLLLSAFAVTVHAVMIIEFSAFCRPFIFKQGAAARHGKHRGDHDGDPAQYPLHALFSLHDSLPLRIFLTRKNSKPAASTMPNTTYP